MKRLPLAERYDEDGNAVPRIGEQWGDYVIRCYSCRDERMGQAATKEEFAFMVMMEGSWKLLPAFSLCAKCGKNNLRVAHLRLLGWMYRRSALVVYPLIAFAWFCLIAVGFTLMEVIK